MSPFHATLCLTALACIILPSHARFFTYYPVNTIIAKTYLDSDSYQYHNEERSWNDALMTCSNEGRELFYPLDGDEVRDVFEFIGENTSEMPEAIHVGISDAEKIGDWKTIADVPIAKVYNKWHHGYPRPTANSNCVGLFDSTKDYFNYHCSDVKMNFVCRKNPNAITIVNI